VLVSTPIYIYIVYAMKEKGCNISTPSSCVFLPFKTCIWFDFLKQIKNIDRYTGHFTSKKFTHELPFYPVSRDEIYKTINMFSL
jgi:hypothetical protein